MTSPVGVGGSPVMPTALVVLADFDAMAALLDVALRAVLGVGRADECFAARRRRGWRGRNGVVAGFVAPAYFGQRVVEAAFDAGVVDVAKSIGVLRQEVAGGGEGDVVAGGADNPDLGAD